MATYNNDNYAGGRGQLVICDINVTPNEKNRGLYDITASLREGNRYDHIKTTVTPILLNALMKASPEKRPELFRSFFPHWRGALSPEHLDPTQLYNELKDNIHLGDGVKLNMTDPREIASNIFNQLSREQTETRGLTR